MGPRTEADQRIDELRIVQLVERGEEVAARAREPT
jgi:hypothetical protein